MNNGRPRSRWHLVAIPSGYQLPHLSRKYHHRQGKHFPIGLRNDRAFVQLTGLPKQVLNREVMVLIMGMVLLDRCRVLMAVLSLRCRVVVRMNAGGLVVLMVRNAVMRQYEGIGEQEKEEDELFPEHLDKDKRLARFADLLKAGNHLPKKHCCSVVLFD
jgi:hypothetical protein